MQQKPPNFRYTITQTVSANTVFGDEKAVKAAR
jgi:hypothetical protein